MHNLFKALSKLSFAFISMALAQQYVAHAGDIEAHDSSHVETMQGSDSFGESYDARRGDISFEFPLFSIPGPNNMKMGVSMSFNKSGAGSMGGWNIGVPAISAADCLSTKQFVPTSPIYANYGKTFTLTLPNQGTKRFIVNTNSPFSSADFITTDGWTATCVPTTVPADGAIPGTVPRVLSAKSEFLIRSPEGMIYRFFRQPLVPAVGNCGGTYRTPNAGGSLVSNIEDLHGNKISYTYVFATPYTTTKEDYTIPYTNNKCSFKSLVSKITRSDGAVINFGIIPITFTYKAQLGSATIGDQTYGSVTANGKTWTFQYRDGFEGITGYYSPVGAMGNNYFLKSITRPDGKMWQFSMTSFGGPDSITGQLPGLGQDSNGVPVNIMMGRGLQITRMVAPNGLVADYSYTIFPEPYLDYWGWPFSSTTSLANLYNFYPILSLASKTYSGPGLSSPISWSYRYYVPNFNYSQIGTIGVYGSPQTSSGMGDPFSYTFEIGPSKLKVTKFRKNPSAFDNGLEVESGTFPLPPATTLASCPFNGLAIASGSSVTAFLAPSVPYGSNCISETRTCTDSVLSGSYQYASCEVQTAPAISAPVASSATLITSSSFKARWGSVTGATGYNLDISTSNSFSSFVVGYNNFNAGTALSRNVSGLSPSTTYYYRVRARNLTSTSLNSTTISVATIAAAVSCPFNGLTITSGSSVTAYLAPSVPYGSNCISETRTCTNSVLSGSYLYSSCSPEAAPTAAPVAGNPTLIGPSGFTANWGGVSGATGYYLDVSTTSAFLTYVSGYNNLSVGTSLSRNVSGLTNNTNYYYRVRATNGSTTSSNSATITARTRSPLSCPFNDLTVASGDSVPAFLTTSVAYGSSCISEMRVCNDGNLTGSYIYSACTVQSATPDPCPFNGTMIPSGTSVSAALTGTVPPCSGQCKYETRTCTNGSLSGSYTFSKCSVEKLCAGCSCQ